MVDLLLGGGRCNFVPSTTQNSCRDDNLDLLAYARDEGFAIATNRTQFNALNGTLPILGLFSDGRPALNQR